MTRPTTPAGSPADPCSTGSTRPRKQFYNGGDIKGLTEKLDYIQSLGMNAIWITPPYENDPVQICPTTLGVLPRLLDHRL
ncbi:MAG: alpha-amylase family glycosyl hydrolase [Micropruina glycogenica]